MSAWSLNEVEEERNTLFLETAVQAKHNHDPVADILAVAMEHFKFSCGGFNGYFRDRNEMVIEIRDIIAHEIRMAKLLEKP